MAKINFSDHSLTKKSCPEGKARVIYYDKKLPKLACVVSKTGIKTFALHTWDRIRKKPLQYTIGRYPEVSIIQARDEATKLLAKITSGEDIKEAAKSIRDEATFNDLATKWIENATDHKRTWKEDERKYNLHIKPTFGNKRISTITTGQIRKWHTNLPKKYRKNKLAGKKAFLSKATANRCLALMKTIFNHEAPELTNPCDRVKAFKESSRDRFLKPDELKQFFQAVHSEETPATTRDLVLLLLLTGARRSNLLSMKWSEIDFTLNSWTIPAKKSKNGEPMTIPLVTPALEILLSRKKEASSIFIFPGKGKTGHLAEPRKGWEALVRRSGLSNLRLHDLRRTCGSYQAASGSSQVIIGKSLGHKHIATTAIYTRLDLDPVRESMEKGAAAMMETMKLPEKIIPIGKAGND